MGLSPPPEPQFDITPLPARAGTPCLRDSVIVASPCLGTLGANLPPLLGGGGGGVIDFGRINEKLVEEGSNNNTTHTHTLIYNYTRKRYDGVFKQSVYCRARGSSPSL